MKPKWSSWWVVRSRRRPSGDHVGGERPADLVPAGLPGGQVNQADLAGPVLVRHRGQRADGRREDSVVPVGRQVAAPVAVQHEALARPVDEGAPRHHPVAGQDQRLRRPVRAGLGPDRGRRGRRRGGARGGGRRRRLRAKQHERQGDGDDRDQGGARRRGPAPPPQPAAPAERADGQVGHRPDPVREIVYGHPQRVLHRPGHRFTSERVVSSSRAGTSSRSFASARDAWLATVPARQPRIAAVRSTLRSSR